MQLLLIVLKKNLIKYFILLFFIFSLSAFNFRDVMVGSWNLQYIYNTNGQSIRDMTFSDSLTGFIITMGTYSSGFSILKTTNGGDNWFTALHLDTAYMKKIQAVNRDSLIICEGNSIFKTTNKGTNWVRLFYPYYPYNEMLGYSIYAINYDTIWLAAGTGFGQPKLYLTTNSGINWTKKFELTTGSQFEGVYFFNKQIGFCWTFSNIYKTTNGGENWFLLLTTTGTVKIQFSDSMTGWKSDSYYYQMKKTTDGGYNWVTQLLPTGGQISETRMYDFQVLNKDTIWGCGGSIYHSPPPNRKKGIIYKTTNGGLNWGYQVLDSNIVKYSFYNHISFYNKRFGWVYESDSGSGIRAGGVHTITGGLDTTFYVGINNQSEIVTNDFALYQNYPNPFNPATNIKYKIVNYKFITIKIFSILGKEVATLVNKKQKAGEYEVKFDGAGLSSGVYYYALYADGVRMDAKKMLMLK